MKRLIRKIPIVGPALRQAYRGLVVSRGPRYVESSRDYWDQRYRSGGNSGDGSKGKLAEFKARILNKFVVENCITTVIEYGCGDGRQLTLAKYPSYVGFDVSPIALAMCRSAFAGDLTKSFRAIDDYDSETAELTISLDVIFHLVEDSVFAGYMDRLFGSATRFVIIYSSDTDANPVGQAAHVKHRNFSEWVSEAKPAWQMTRRIPNEFPWAGDTNNGSFADFFIYERANGPSE